MAWSPSRRASSQNSKPFGSCLPSMTRMSPAISLRWSSSCCGTASVLRPPSRASRRLGLAAQAPSTGTLTSAPSCAGRSPRGCSGRLASAWTAGTAAECRVASHSGIGVVRVRIGTQTGTSPTASVGTREAATGLSWPTSASRRCRSFRRGMGRTLAWCPWRRMLMCLGSCSSCWTQRTRLRTIGQGTGVARSTASTTAPLPAARTRTERRCLRATSSCARSGTRTGTSG
mmetsp:Transcript_11249/g.30701  ORF Transcript_11249/g.30701 Transcript_11249/m.30701 type:complete len:230 (-) Transcript_11249:625-1314(-)